MTRSSVTQPWSDMANIQSCQHQSVSVDILTDFTALSALQLGLGHTIQSNSCFATNNANNLQIHKPTNNSVYVLDCEVLGWQKREVVLVSWRSWYFSCKLRILQIVAELHGVSDVWLGQCLLFNVPHPAESCYSLMFILHPSLHSSYYIIMLTQVFVAESEVKCDPSNFQWMKLSKAT